MCGVSSVRFWGLILFYGRWGKFSYIFLGFWIRFLFFGGLVLEGWREYRCDGSIFSFCSDEDG